jgi:hypothetical protein
VLKAHNVAGLVAGGEVAREEGHSLRYSPSVEYLGVGPLGALCHDVRGTEEWTREIYP